MKYLFTLILFSFIYSNVDAVEQNYDISITVKGMENKMGLLAYYYGDKKYVKDTLYFDAKGKTTIKGKKEIARGVYILAFPSMRYASFDLIITEPNFSIITDTSNFIMHAKIKNSPENAQMFADMQYMYPVGKANDSLRKIFRTMKESDTAFLSTETAINNISSKIEQHRKKTITSHPTTFYSQLLKVMMDVNVPEGKRKPDGSLEDTFHVFHYTQQHYFDAIDFRDSGYIRSPVFRDKLLNYFDKYVFPIPDSIIQSVDFVLKKAEVNPEMFQFCVNELFTKYAKSEVMGEDAIYVYIADNYLLNGKAWWADKSNFTELKDRVDALRPTLIGKIAPNFSVQDTSGKNHYFHDFISKNKYTVLVFWNSDCSHCQHEIPRLKKIYDDSLKTLPVQIFTVSTEQTDSSFRTFAAKNCHSDWVTCADMFGKSAFRKEYDVIATPKVYVIKNDYKILAKNIPIDNIPDFIKYEEKKEKK
ncbi:MAG: redoxin domain-containing protein [Bacteroidetes bacterium]|nr:redoxin domain-containing protein [Bacteroidota bacterium]